MSRIDCQVVMSTLRPGCCTMIQLKNSCFTSSVCLLQASYMLLVACSFQFVNMLQIAMHIRPASKGRPDATICINGQYDKSTHHSSLAAQGANQEHAARLGHQGKHECHTDDVVPADDMIPVHTVAHAVWLHVLALLHMQKLLHLETCLT